MVASIAYQSKREEFQQTRRNHWNAIAQAAAPLGWLKRGYDHRIAQVFDYAVGSGKRVLELGCGTGKLLAALKPAYGLGIDFSEAMVAAAKAAHPSLQFVCATAENLIEALNPVAAAQAEPFDYILLPDILNDVWDAHAVLDQARKLCSPGTRIVITAYSRVWEWPHKLASAMGLATP